MLMDAHRHIGNRTTRHIPGHHHASQMMIDRWLLSGKNVRWDNAAFSLNDSGKHSLHWMLTDAHRYIGNRATSQHNITP